MTGKEYEQYLQTSGVARQHQFNFGFWLAVTGIGFVLPLVGYMLNG